MRKVCAKLANFGDLFSLKFGILVPVTKRREPKATGMLQILGLRDPFKIGRDIVRFMCIPVVNLLAACWCWRQEADCDKSMHVDGAPLTLAAKVDDWVPLGRRVGTDDFSAPSYPAKVRDMGVIVSGDRTPFFRERAKLKLYHGLTSCGALPAAACNSAQVFLCPFYQDLAL